jgi:hypothetical protein
MSTKPAGLGGDEGLETERMSLLYPLSSLAIEEVGGGLEFISMYLVSEHTYLSGL